MNEVIERWGDEPVNSFRYKKEKYHEVLKILDELDSKYSYYKNKDSLSVL